MYEFRKFQFDWLNIFVFAPEVGALWKKCFVAGVTPQNQSTLNIYASGQFRVYTETGSFEQVLTVGESSLDLGIAEFPVDDLVIETPIVPMSCRLCLSVERGGKWSREHRLAVANEPIELLAHQIAVVIPAAGWTGEGAPDVRVGQPFTAPSDSHVYIMQKL